MRMSKVLGEKWRWGTKARAFGCGKNIFLQRADEFNAYMGASF